MKELDSELAALAAGSDYDPNVPKSPMFQFSADSVPKSPVYHEDSPSRNRSKSVFVGMSSAPVVHLPKNIGGHSRNTSFSSPPDRTTPVIDRSSRLSVTVTPSETSNSMALVRVPTNSGQITPKISLSAPTFDLRKDSSASLTVTPKHTANIPSASPSASIVGGSQKRLNFESFVDLLHRVSLHIAELMNKKGIVAPVPDDVPRYFYL